MGRVILITGGARSGKSAYALELAPPSGRRVFIATAEPVDEEMRARIARHRKDRGSGWETVEEALDPAGVLGRQRDGVVVMDCIAVWVSNLLVKGVEPEGRIEAFHREVESWRGRTDEGSRLVLVTNEVGMGLVPPTPLGRRFRDLLGSVNRELAARADEVVLMVTGIPVRIK
ncbi:bifunctional adenosylcobinamide kinase/adenosylcobinamide-phosphate guanylyltransferase [Spirochaeta thermophila]|uniref:Adenosylcobinamide kinase n=1 Tax=Winmispira thermophila (strain ATCC 49972 / DSM 6192 / RI 19.B1) TaxID=665571 RepID=E0RRF9_WINT6|nr:bifunctional adenosylcobinamide kinase/adenosylcobinamide-phosphate guanylyltransferase [Spirochaeta thermophila]ADN01660.1 hypothetical protein STHERM_c07020 [Spirochaeta thermophila DSM 6192]